MRSELLDIINQLPDHHKLVFNLYVIDRYSHAEISKALGISEGTSKSHLSRARKKIREWLAQKSKEDNKKTNGLFYCSVFPTDFGVLIIFLDESFQILKYLPRNRYHLNSMSQV